MSVSSLLAPQGHVRVAVNLGNPLLAWLDRSGEPAGPAVALAGEIARRLGLQSMFVTYDGAGRVVDAVAADEWDLAFLAFDPLRAQQIAFSRPYRVIEGALLVRAQESWTDWHELDHPGIRVAAARGAAYALHLERALKSAALVYALTSADTPDLYLREGLDAAAGIREPLQAWAERHPGHRVMEPAFMQIRQAVAVPAARGAEVAAEIDAIVSMLIDSGFIASLFASRED